MKGDKVTNQFGVVLSFSKAVREMDSVLSYELSNLIAPCSKKKFISAYEKVHLEKFGKKWCLSKKKIAAYYRKYYIRNK